MELIVQKTSCSLGPIIFYNNCCQGIQVSHFFTFSSGSVLLSTKNAQTLVHVGAADVIFVCFQSGFAPTAPTFRVRTLLVQCTNKVQVGARWCTIDYSDLNRKRSRNKTKQTVGVSFCSLVTLITVLRRSITVL